MRTGEHVFALLSVHAPLVALVGDRIYPLVAPQNAPAPRVVFTVVDDVGVTSLQGFTSGLSIVRLQVDAYSRDYDEAQAVADAVDDVLKSHVTLLFSSVRVARRDLYEDTTELNRVSLDFTISKKEE